MFDIEYKGGNTIVITSKKASLIVDPRMSVVGLRDIKTKDEVEVVTEPRFSVDNSEARIIIDSPGEYEVGDFTIKGTAALRHIDAPDKEKLSTVYRVECGGIAVGLIGNIASGLDDSQLEALGVIDVLVIPVGGGGYTLDATSAASLVRSIDPKIAVPIHYRDTALHYEVPQDDIEVFNKELGAPVETVQKLRIKNEATLPLVLTNMIVTRS